MKTQSRSRKPRATRVDADGTITERLQIIPDYDIVRPDIRPTHILDKPGLTKALQTILYSDDLEWDLCPVITSKRACQVEEVNDDIKREEQFHEHALDAVREARLRMFAGETFKWTDPMGDLNRSVPKPLDAVAFTRPRDYYAEMVKSDVHMKHLRQRLVSQKEALNESERVAEKRAMKKLSKKVQVEKEIARKRKAKEEIEGYKKLVIKKRKDGEGKVKSLFLKNQQAFDPDLIDPLNVDISRKRGETTKRKKRKVTKKQQWKASKYGSGGRKRGSKRNDAASSAAVGASWKKSRASKRPNPVKRRQMRARK